MSDAVPAAEVLRRLDHDALLKVRSVRSAADIEDARSEFYLALLEGRARWNGEGSLLAWARRVVLNIAADGLGPASWREVPVERPDDPALGAAAPAETSEPLELGAERRPLLKLLGRLSDKRRRALEYAAAGYTTEEIAERMGISPRGARKLLTEASAELRRVSRFVRAVPNGGVDTRGGSSTSGLSTHAA